MADNAKPRPVLNARELARVGRYYAGRYAPDPQLPRELYLQRVHAITQELYPTKRYPGKGN